MRKTTYEVWRHYPGAADMIVRYVWVGELDTLAKARAHATVRDGFRNNALITKTTRVRVPVKPRRSSRAPPRPR